MLAISKVLSLLVGIALGAALFGVVVGLAGALVVITGLGLSLLGRRDWVPVAYNLRSLGVRRWTTAVTALGLGLVTFVFTTALMLANGVHTTLRATGSEDNAKVVRKASQSELMSALTPDQVRLLGAAPEVGMGRDGKPLISPELVVVIYAQREGSASETDGSNVNVRGIDAHALELHPPHALEGRMFKPGTSEVVIGKKLDGRFRGMRLNQQVYFARRNWTVVGIMDQGNAFDSEVWGDLEQFEDAFQRRPTVSSVTLRLRDRGALAALQQRMEGDPNLNALEVKSEVDYWASQSELTGKYLSFLGLFVAIIFSFGAVLGAMITMYAQVAARTREIGTLRALGFRRRAVLVSFVVESVLLALVAGALGVAASSLMQLTSFTTMNFQSFSEVSFRFHLTPNIAVTGLIFAAVLGFAGGLLPALRAARLAITTATRGG